MPLWSCVPQRDYDAPEPPVAAPPPAAAAPPPASSAESWLAKGIVVKIMNERVGGGKYFEQKGVIIKVREPACAGN